MDQPLANPTDLKEDLAIPLTGATSSSTVFTGALLLESDAGAGTDWLLMEADTDGSDYRELEGT